MNRINPDLERKYKEDEHFKKVRINLTRDFIDLQEKIKRIEDKIKLWDSINGLTMWDKK